MSTLQNKLFVTGLNCYPSHINKEHLSWLNSTMFNSLIPSNIPYVHWLFCIYDLDLFKNRIPQPDFELILPFLVISVATIFLYMCCFNSNCPTCFCDTNLFRHYYGYRNWCLQNDLFFNEANTHTHKINCIIYCLAYFSAFHQVHTTTEVLQWSRIMKLFIQIANNIYHVDTNILYSTCLLFPMGVFIFLCANPIKFY